MLRKKRNNFKTDNGRAIGEFARKYGNFYSVASVICHKYFKFIFSSHCSCTVPKHKPIVILMKNTSKKLQKALIHKILHTLSDL
jgi:hypothetical protein